MSGVIAKAYSAIANESPCVVPSVDAILPFPGMIILIGALYVLPGSWRVKGCHWNFGPGKIGPGTKISAGKNGPPDQIFW